MPACGWNAADSARKNRPAPIARSIATSDAPRAGQGCDALCRAAHGVGTSADESAPLAGRFRKSTSGVILQENFQFAWCRKLGQLKSLRLFQINSGGYEAFVARELSHGMRWRNQTLSLSLKMAGREFFQGFISSLRIDHLTDCPDALLHLGALWCTLVRGGGGGS